jgi:tRNA (Thr-GGU) A37 N-methylase
MTGQKRRLPRVYRIQITDVEEGTPVLDLQWLIEETTLQFVVRDICYQLAVPSPPVENARPPERP